MTRWALLTLSLTIVYVLVLASVQPGDLLIGAVLAGCLAAAIVRTNPPRPAPGGRSPLARVLSAPVFLLRVAFDLTRATWHVGAYALGRRPVEHPGFVEIPLAERSPSGVVAWGVLTGVTPDEVVVNIDEERGVALIHVLDDRDPDAVRARHRATYERHTRRVFP